MTFIKYKDFRFTPRTLELIQVCNDVIEDWHQQGYDLTLRTVYYQLVSQDIIPNNINEYRRLGSIINDARLAGMISWDAIEDQNRNLKSRNHWESPKEFINDVVPQYFSDLWVNQKYRPEVWVEKDALSSVASKACRPFDVPFLACKGYMSQTEMWQAAQRFREYADEGQIPIVIHLGDHDPSGIDMSRDIEDRIRMLMFKNTDGVVSKKASQVFQFKRIALNADQIAKYNPPPNPAKLTDSRGNNYVSIHGNKSWELDALKPSVINDLIVKNIKQVADMPLIEKAKLRVIADKDQLLRVAKNWSQIIRSLR